MAAPERIQIEVTENGSRVVRRNLEDIGSSAKLAATGVGLLQAALAGLSFKAAANIVDAYTLMQKKIISVTDSQAQLAAVTQRLYEVAQNTRQGISTVTDAYFRFNGALEKMGYSQEQVIGLTESISKAFIIAGSTAEETERAMIQLAQGFSKNKLQTQDLKAAMEQAPYVIQVLARNLNIAGLSAAQAESSLYSLAEQGKLTSKVMFEAFQSARKEIEEKFLKTLPTIQQGFIALEREFSRFLGSAARESGVADAIGRAMQDLAGNFKEVAKYVEAAGVAFLTFFAITRGIPAVAALIVGMGATLLTIPGMIAAAAGAFVLWGDQVKLASDGTATLKDLAVVAFGQMKVAVTQWAAEAAKRFPAVGKLAQAMFGDMDFSLKGVLVGAVQVAQSLSVVFAAAYATTVETWRQFPAALYDLMVTAVNKATGVVADFLNYTYNGIKDFIGNLVGKQFDELRLGGTDIKVTGAANEIANTFTTKVTEGMKNLTPAGEIIRKLYADAEDYAKKSAAEQIKKAEDVKKATEDLNKARANRIPEIQGDVQVLLNNLDKEAKVLGFINDEYTVRHQLLAIEKNLHRDLGDAERGALETAIQRNLALTRQKELLEQIRAPQTEYQNGMTALNALMAQNKITQDEYNASIDQMTLKFLNALPPATNFAQGYIRQLQIMSIETKNATGQLGTEFAKIFGPGGALTKGIGDAVAQSIVFGKSWKESIRSVAQSILSQLISALVQTGVNMLLNATLGQSLMAATTAAGVAEGAALTAAYTPAATMASLATGGANAGGAATGISSIMSLMMGVVGSMGGLFKGFKDGGYTGPVGQNQVAGLVHGQEFVMNASATRKHRATLEALNAGRDLGNQVVAPQAPQVNFSIRNEIPDAAYETRSLSETEIEIIARRVVHRDAPEVISNELRNPNGRVSRSLGQSTNTSRRRG